MNNQTLTSPTPPLLSSFSRLGTCNTTTRRTRALHHQPFGVQALIPGEGLQSGGGVLHRKVTEKLNSLKELAVRRAERNDRIERAGRAQVGGSGGGSVSVSDFNGCVGFNSWC